jgi:aminopeptidase N
MKGNKDNIMPIMTNSESIYQFGNNAYGKPATALNILRETVMGRELFDYAFKQYAQRWKFKHPTPADFFRTMEDASGVDLDWFWRGWFFTTDHVDQAIEDVDWYRVNTKDPNMEKPLAEKKAKNAPANISTVRDDQQKMVEQTAVERESELEDFYTNYDPFEVTVLDEQEYKNYLSNLSSEDKELLEAGYNYYEVTIRNDGGLVMPVILKFEYEDGSEETKRIPAEIWKMNDKEVTKVFYSKKKAENIALDPYLEIADTDREDNYWPKRDKPTRFELFKQQSRNGENKMQRNRRAERMDG